MDKVAYIYNKFHTAFIEEVVSCCPSGETKTQLESVLAASKERSPTSKRVIERFVEKNNVKVDVVFEIGPNALLADPKAKSIELVKRVKVCDIAPIKNDDVYVPCYLYLFTALAYLYDKAVYALDLDGNDESDSSSDDEATCDGGVSKITVEEANALIEAALDIIKCLQNGEAVDIESKVDGRDAKLVSILSNLAKVVDPIKSIGVDGGTGDDRDAARSENLADGAADMLKNTKIGNLAKEISEEIDLSSLKIEKPEDILNMKSLGENNLLTNIISKVGSKIHQKIDNGELKHEDLMKEAMSMLSMFGKDAKGGGPAADILNNPMFKDVMKNMGSLGGLGGLANIAGMMNQSDKAKSSKVRDRLRRKLDEKKKH